MNNQHEYRKFIEKLHEEFLDLGLKLVEEKSFVKIEVQERIVGFIDPRNNCHFCYNSADFLGTQRNIKAMSKALKGKPYKVVPLRSGTGQVIDTEQLFEPWFKEQGFQSLTLQNDDGHFFIRSADFPFMYEEIKSASRSTRDRVVKQCSQFEKLLASFHEKLDEAVRSGFEYDVNEAGEMLLQNHIQTIQLTISGSPKQCLASLDKAMRMQQANVPKQSVAEKTKLKKPRKSDLITPPEVPSQVSDSEVIQRTDAPHLPPTRIVYGEQVSGTPFALHNRSYKGVLPPINDDEKFSVILDTGVIIKCFGKGANEQTRKFGVEVFNSLLENPRISAIIIPDYIANIEASGTHKIYDKSGRQKIDYTRENNKINGDYYRQSLQNLLKRSVYLRASDVGSEALYVDASVPPSSIIPKLIVWENAKGMALARTYRKEIEHRQANKNLQKKPGEHFGEMQIEALLNDPQFPAKKIAVLTTDYRYVEDHATDEVAEGKQVCRMNLNHYLTDLIRKNPLETMKWSDLSGFTYRAERDHRFNDELREYILHDVVAELDKNMPEQTYTSSAFPICSNKQMSAEIVGCESPDTQMSAEQVRKNDLLRNKRSISNAVK